jgi:hypothetical protein
LVATLATLGNFSNLHKSKMAAKRQGRNLDIAFKQNTKQLLAVHRFGGILACRIHFQGEFED